uniref:Uncharacterized protein n=1 Tax=Mus spicilegus TaxID=10103 RepID=A0A8C6H233_MUSSI
MPGTRPMRRTIMCRQLLLVSSRTALPIVVLSRLSPFTSVILSPTHRPARSAQEGWRYGSGPVHREPVPQGLAPLLASEALSCSQALCRLTSVTVV